MAAPALRALHDGAAPTPILRPLVIPVVSGAWAAIKECLGDLAEVIGNIQDRLLGDELTATNSLGVAAASTSFALCQRLYPAMWSVAFSKINIISLTVAITLGATGVVGFGVSQVVLVTYLNRWFPAGPARGQLARCTVAIYLCASCIPPITHFALHHSAMRLALSMDVWGLMLASNKLACTLDSERATMITHSAAEAAQVESLCARVLGTGSASAPLVALGGARTCAGTSLVWALWLPSALPPHLAV